MKNKLDEKILVPSLDENKSKEFNSKLGVIKEKVVKFRELEKESTILQLEARKLADDFVEEFKDNKRELGKIVSWIGDVYKRDELVSILGDSITKERGKPSSLDVELVKVPVRLDHGLRKPEYYSNERVSNLVETLNKYDNYIDTFESIEVTDNSNCLDRNFYLIEHRLHDVLINGFQLKRDRKISKSEKGIYIVVFKSIKVEGKDVLIYKYIKYPYIFYDCLYHYFIQESGSLAITDDNSVGMDFLFVMENFFSNNEEDTRAKMKQISEKFGLKCINKRGIYPRNVIDMFKTLLQGCPIKMDLDNIVHFIELLLKRNTYDTISNILSIYGFYEDENQRRGLEILRENLNKPKYENYNLLGRVVFVTEDLDGLVRKLRGSFGKSVNQGPQPWRGQSDSLSHVIHGIDTDFRRSMNRHNQHHVNIGNIPRNSLIGRSKFSYQNIHLNLGNVRWNSSKAYAKTNTIESQALFHDITEYIKKSPINNDTELKIENVLYDSSYISLTQKTANPDKPMINYKLINKDFSDLLLGERTKLMDYINRDRKISFEEEPTKTNDIIQNLLGKVLRVLSDNYLISVIYGRLFKILSKYDVDVENNTSLGIFVDIGSDLVQNYFFELYSEDKKKKIIMCDKSTECSCNKKSGCIQYTLSDWKRENVMIVNAFDNASDNTVKAELGARIVNILKALDLIQLKVITKGKEEKLGVIVPTSRVTATLDKEQKIHPLPRRLPMIVKPKNYSRVDTKDGVRESLGGYLLNDEKYTHPLMIPKWNFRKPTLIKNDNLVYDLVNNINSVGFKINKDVLDFINVYGSRYNLVINSSFVHPLSTKSKLSKQEFKELTSFLSKKDLQDNILGLAGIFSHVHEFFLPTRLDFRGRLYCVSEYLTYQSTELAKALILFSNSERIYKTDKVSIDYLKAYGANCFGNKLDKMSWKSRSKWVDNNIDKISQFRDGELLEKAEKKLLFLAFCFEYNRFLECLDNDKEYFETSLPIQLDATCNGYQHLALLSLDNDLAKELNLTKSTPESQPKDFYNFAAVKLINYFRDQLSNNNLSEQEKEVYTRFSHLTIARKIVKKVIMTIPYNVTPKATIDYLKDNFEIEDYSDKSNVTYSYKEDNKVILMEKDFPILAKGLKTVLFDDRFKLTKLLTYLNQVVKVVTTLNLPIYWGTPSTGVDIQQSYVASIEERLKPFSYSKNTFKIKVADKSKANVRKQKISFLPNFIHSLDAASLALLVHYYFTDESFKVKNIYTIHDCFAVTANNVKNLIFSLSHVYQKIYTEKNYLREFDQQMIEFILKTRKDVSFDKNTLKITMKDGKILKYPSVEAVLGINCNVDGLIKESPYLIH